MVAVWELSQALATRGVQIPLVPLTLGSVLMLVGAYVGGADTLVVVLGVTTVAVVAWRLGVSARPPAAPNPIESL